MCVCVCVCVCLCVCVCECVGGWVHARTRASYLLVVLDDKYKNGSIHSLNTKSTTVTHVRFNVGLVRGF